ncbi:MAG: ATP-dependent helicase, partial [Lachnospiraceae bacterium]|nr:ATP-dependent helicase [Lachnospiraceae bacterium]
MKQLNKEQQMAVRHTDGPLLVLAGPGSGKTAVLTEHIQYLIGEKNVMPEQIHALTFSRKAAAEMRRRFLKNTGEEATFVTFGTFHSVFFSVLRQYDTRSRQIISPAEQIRLIRDVLRKSGQTEIDTDLCLQFLNRISFYKNTGKIPRSLSVPEEVFLSVHEQYRQSMQRSGLIDYDDMIGNCLCLLRENPLILRNLQDRYLHILVDEFQDCNEMQYDLLKLLSKRHGHLFAVGDDDQSIYAFRGARGQIMQQFLKDHPDCSTVNLIRNYRCAASVIGVADRFIHCNSDRIGKPKQLPSKLRGAGTVLMLFAKDAYEEAVRVHEEICRLLAENTCKRSEIAILYRSEQCADFLEEYLQDHGKSCSRKRKNTFYAQTCVLETLSYLSLSQGDYARSRF